MLNSKTAITSFFHCLHFKSVGGKSSANLSQLCRSMHLWSWPNSTINCRWAKPTSENSSKISSRQFCNAEKQSGLKAGNRIYFSTLLRSWFYCRYNLQVFFTYNVCWESFQFFLPLVSEFETGEGISNPDQKLYDPLVPPEFWPISSRVC